MNMQKDLALKLNMVHQKNSDTVPADSVICTKSKAGNSQLEEGGTIEVILSKGPVEKLVKWYYKVVTIPYEGSFDETTGEPIPQIVMFIFKINHIQWLNLLRI